MALRPTDRCRGALALAALALIANTPPAASASVGTQDTVQHVPASDTEAAELVADRKRLLYLTDGSILRVRSRFEDGRWEWRDGPRWLPVGGPAVERVASERELLAGARAQERLVGKADLEGRVELARWLVEQGLYPEAIEALDRVFAVEREHAGGLALIADVSIPLGDDAWEAFGPAARLKTLLYTGASGSPATREVAVRRIAELLDAVALREVVRAELGAAQHARRELATLVARRLFTGELLEELATRAILDGYRDVRCGAALGLRAAGDVSVIGPALRALESANATVRANAAESLGNIGYAAAVEPLVARLAAIQGGGGPSGTRANLFVGRQTAYLQDYDAEIAQGASIAEPVIAALNSGVVLDVRSVPQITQVIELRRIVAALGQLTRADVKDAPDAWLEWWEEHGTEWRSRDRLEEPAGD